ncbi:NmrA-domain-containing protein [Mycena olivaceomarginata]|nr:NmrA-domain-containing protein [Mycena olivaceomarginata]
MTITQDPSAPSSIVKALAESIKPYRVRGFSRDSTKPAAQKLVAQGVEVVDALLVLSNVKNMFKAFEGTNIAFLMTTFLETAEGKTMLDAAKAAGVECIVWSGLSNISKISGGKYTPISGVPFVDVQASNFMNPSQCSVKCPDGSFPIINTECDYDLYIRHVLETPVFPDGEEVCTGKYLTVEQIALQ